MRETFASIQVKKLQTKGVSLRDIASETGTSKVEVSGWRRGTELPTGDRKVWLEQLYEEYCGGSG